MIPSAALDSLKNLPALCASKVDKHSITVRSQIHREILFSPVNTNHKKLFCVCQSQTLSFWQVNTRKGNRLALTLRRYKEEVQIRFVCKFVWLLALEKRLIGFYIVLNRTLCGFIPCIILLSSIQFLDECPQFLWKQTRTTSSDQKTACTHETISQT